MIKQITPLILTYNEEPNIGRTLQRLTWADRIVVVDSFSNDATLDILRTYPQVDLFKRPFDTAANQWNFGLAKVTTEWILSLDADFILSDQLIREIQAIPANSAVDGYIARFKHCVLGKTLHATLIPPWTIVYRREKAVYIDDGHTQRVHVSGNSEMLTGYILHDDRKSISRWLHTQDRYMIAEAQKFEEASEGSLDLADHIRKTKILAPFLIFLYCLFLKRGILDGWAGLYYAFQRMTAEMILAMRLIETEQLQSKQTAVLTSTKPETVSH